jgi:oligopeptide transport system substrate-binding protein
MDYSQAAAEFRKLKAQYDAGVLTEADFKARLEELMVQDEQGRWWMIGYETGQWYVHDGEQWMKAQPPAAAPPATRPELRRPASESGVPATGAGQSAVVIPKLWLWAGAGIIGVVLLTLLIPRILPGAPPPATASPTAMRVLPTATTTLPTATMVPPTTTSVPPTITPTSLGVSSTKAATATPPPFAVRKVLRVNAGAYPDIIDPQKSAYTNQIGHLSLIYEGLTDLNAKLETVPGSAEKWEYNKDATELTFTLRKGLMYSDGTPLNAARFKFSLMRNIDPATAGEYAQITDEIRGAAEWRGCGPDQGKCISAKKTLDSSIQTLYPGGKSCDAANPYGDADCMILKLILAKSAPYFHTVMSLWVTYPAKEENIIAGKDIWWTSAKYQIGNGPYILKTIEPSVKAVFVPNTNYYGNKGKIDIEFSYVADSAAAFNAYKNNEFDVIALASADYPAVMADANISKEAKIYPGSCTFALMFHQLKEPFTDPKVRQAFAQTYDRTTWVKDVLAGLGSPTLTWIPPGYPGYDKDEKRWGFNVDEAKKALAASRYGSADKLPPIKLTFSDTPRNRTRNEWLAAQWKQYLGVSITLDPVEATTYSTLTRDVKTSPLIFILGWCADYPDPQNWLSVYWKTGAFGDRIGYSNKKLDTLMDQADIELDPAKRMRMYADAQKMLLDDAPVAMAWNNVNTYLVKPWVNGYTTSPQDYLFLGSLEPGAIDIDATAMTTKK